jgi:hypothetical protein
MANSIQIDKRYHAGRHIPQENGIVGNLRQLVSVPYVTQEVWVLAAKDSVHCICISEETLTFLN